MATGDILNEIDAHAESAKLLRVRQLITALLVEHDICADIMLCGRGRLDIFTHLEASWSCMRMKRDPTTPDEFTLEIKSQHMPKDKHMINTLATVSMAHSMMQVHYGQLSAWSAASKYMDEKTGAVHSDIMRTVNEGPTQ